MNVMRQSACFGLKSLLQQGLSEPEFYGDLVYKLRIIASRAEISEKFRKVIMRYKRIDWPCIKLNDGPNIKLVDLFKLVGTGLSLVCFSVICAQLVVSLCSGISYPEVLRVSQYVFCRVLISDSSYARLVVCLYPMLIH